MNMILIILFLLSILMYIIALGATIYFWRLLKNEKYWLGIPISLFLFLLHNILEIIDFTLGYDTQFSSELLQTVAGLILAISFLFLIMELKKIQKIEIDADKN